MLRWDAWPPFKILKISRSIAYQFLIGLPLTSTLLPIALPTVYLWIVDTMALNRGTWAIESGTKLNWHLWDGLDIELVSDVKLTFQNTNRVLGKPFSSS